ncbi:MAG: hypothetical protein K6G81_08225 [Lachnospiraceae bacterium]|nr:hypothetical protein [Lachnospiraceae bacterium]
MKERLRSIGLIILVALFAGYILVTAILDLTNQKDIYTIRLDEAVEMLEIEHSIGGLIPVGKDHYFLGINDESGDAVIIKASKSWYKKNFDEATYCAKAPGGLTVTSLAKSAGKFSVESELINMTAQFEGLNFIVEPGSCLTLNYKTMAIVKLALFVLAPVLIFFGWKISKAGTFVSKPAAITYVFGVIAYLIALLIVIL